MDLATLQMVKDGFSLFREGLGAVKEAKALLPASQQEAITQTLERAGTAAALGEAQIAKALGYELHRCTFPPQIMLSVETPNGQIQRCQACGHITDSNGASHQPKTTPSKEPCPLCEDGTLKVIGVTADPIFGEMGLQQRQLKCTKCDHVEYRQHDPNRYAF